MRIIAGTKRRLQLKTLQGKDVRPTTDRIKETLFNMLQDEIPGCYFLDLFAGSGQIGLEAVSRGARFAVFAERSKQAADCIEQRKYPCYEIRRRIASFAERCDVGASFSGRNLSI